MKKGKAMPRTTDANVLLSRAAWYETKSLLAKTAGDHKRAAGFRLNARKNFDKALQAS